MYEIIDKIILFIGCLVLYLFHGDISYAIIPVIIVISFSCLFTYYENRRTKAAGNLLFLLLCFWKPAYAIFLPVLLYDIFCTGYQYLVLGLPILLISQRSAFDPAVILYTLTNAGLSYVLKLKSNKLSKLKRDYNELRDNSTKLSRALEEKNRSLLKNQDYEVNLATLNERNRISRELHDNIGHLLSRALLQVGALLTVTKEDVTKEGLTDLKESLSRGMDDIRSSIHKMYDESIDLFTQVRQLVHEFSFCEVNFEYDIKLPPGLDLKYSLIAIIKEALSNIMKHSNATKASVILREHPAMYQLIIEDNGIIGKDAGSRILDQLNNRNFQGMGLQNISDRVKGYNGNMNISLDKGFQLFIMIPKKKLATK